MLQRDLHPGHRRLLLEQHLLRVGNVRGQERLPAFGRERLRQWDLLRLRQFLRGRRPHLPLARRDAVHRRYELRERDLRRRPDVRSHRPDRLWQRVFLRHGDRVRARRRRLLPVGQPDLRGVPQPTAAVPRAGVWVFAHVLPPGHAELRRRLLLGNAAAPVLPAVGTGFFVLQRDLPHQRRDLL